MQQEKQDEHWFANFKGYMLLTLPKSQNHPIHVKRNPRQVLQLAQFKVTQNICHYMTQLHFILEV